MYKFVLNIHKDEMCALWEFLIAILKIKILEKLNTYFLVVTI